MLKYKFPLAFILCSLLLCVLAPGAPEARAGRLRANPVQTQTVEGRFTASVKRDEAHFTLPVPPRPQWKWRLAETPSNAREYAMDVSVVNEAKEYHFGFYVWKRAGALTESGSFSDLIRDGQKSVFERATTGHFVLVRDAGIKVRNEGDNLVIEIRGRKNVERLFSGRPAEVTFKVEVPDQPPASKSVRVSHED